MSDSESESDSDTDDETGPIEKATRAGANLSVPKKASIVRERKMQSNPLGKIRVPRRNK